MAASHLPENETLAERGFAVARNLIGPEGMAAWPRLAATPGVVPHLYGKGAARPGRKMGHANRLIPLGRLAAMAEDEALHGL